MLKKAITTAFGTFLFLIPFKIQTVLAATPIFLQGNFNPYTTLFLTFPDIVLAILLILIGIDIFRKPKLEKNRELLIVIIAFGIFVAMGLISFTWAENKSAVLISSARLIISTLIPACLLTSSYFKKERQKLIKIFIVAMLVQSVIGILQFTFQHSLGLHAIGESHISPTEPGIAKMDFMNKKIVRAYGTFPHSNIFAAFTLMTLFLTPYIRNKRFKWTIRILLAIALLLTFSRSIWIIATITAIAYMAINKKIYKRNVKAILAAGIVLLVMLSMWPLARERLNITNDTSLQERLEGMETSIHMIRANPQGVGLGNYTENLQKFTENHLAPWEYQPVHNTFLLAGAETGVQGILALILFLATILIWKAHKKNYNGLVFAIALIGFMLVDHYLLSIPQGQYLFGILTGFTLNENRG